MALAHEILSLTKGLLVPDWLMAWHKVLRWWFFGNLLLW